jgi:hypothetical protein
MGELEAGIRAMHLHEYLLQILAGLDSPKAFPVLVWSDLGRSVGLESDAAQKNTALLGATELLFRRSFSCDPTSDETGVFVAPN